MRCFIKHVRYKGRHVRCFTKHVRYKERHVRYKARHMRCFTKHVRCKGRHVRCFTKHVRYKGRHVRCFTNPALRWFHHRWGVRQVLLAKLPIISLFEIFPMSKLDNEDFQSESKLFQYLRTPALRGLFS